jgi:hypothetical protein
MLEIRKTLSELGYTHPFWEIGKQSHPATRRAADHGWLLQRLRRRLAALRGCSGTDSREAKCAKLL